MRTGTEEDIAAQLAVTRDLRALIEESVEIVNASEWTRRQLYDLREALEELRQDDRETSETGRDEGGAGEDGPSEEAEESESASTAEAPDLVTALAALDDKLKALEGLYFDLRLTGAYQDSLRWKRLLNAQLTRLAWTISGTDLPPTESQLAVYRELKGEVDAARATWQRLRDEEIPTLNDIAAAEGVGAIVVKSAASDGS